MIVQRHYTKLVRPKALHERGSFFFLNSMVEELQAPKPTPSATLMLQGQVVRRCAGKYSYTVGNTSMSKATMLAKLQGNVPPTLKRMKSGSGERMWIRKRFGLRCFDGHVRWDEAMRAFLVWYPSDGDSEHMSMNEVFRHHRSWLKHKLQELRVRRSTGRATPELCPTPKTTSTLSHRSRRALYNAI